MPGFIPGTTSLALNCSETIARIRARYGDLLGEYTALLDTPEGIDRILGLLEANALPGMPRRP
ncbi:MAG: hypothetical protein HY903_02060 [Deltaproteobacteria bacterium]|nr:hypothetical protein [Deltaproteobacteria bacterium]